MYSTLPNCTEFPCPWGPGLFGVSETNMWQLPFTPKGKLTYHTIFTCTHPKPFSVDLAEGFFTDWCSFVYPPCPMTGGKHYQFIVDFNPNQEIYDDSGAEFQRIMKASDYFNCEWGYYTDSATDETGKPFFCFNMTSHTTELGPGKPYGHTFFNHHQQEPHELIVEQYQDRMKVLSKAYKEQPEVTLYPLSKYVIPGSKPKSEL